jgi:hypothetical protein
MPASLSLEIITRQSAPASFAIVDGVMKRAWNTSWSALEA